MVAGVHPPKEKGGPLFEVPPDISRTKREKNGERNSAPRIGYLLTASFKPLPALNFA